MMHQRTIGNTRYTAERLDNLPPQVKLTRYNNSGETVLFIPFSLVMDLARDHIRAKVGSMVARLIEQVTT